MGTRFGGLKQLAPVGPNGETLLEYSVYDAAHAGFGQAVIVIKSTFERQFCDQVLPRLSRLIAADYVVQDKDPIPGEGGAPGQRVWGTAPAVLVAGRKIDRPFSVINADDFYGRAAFTAAGDALRRRWQSRNGSYFLVGYDLGATLSPNGPVSRGVCDLDGRMLTAIVEHTRLVNGDGHAESLASEPRQIFDLETPVSMNFWGFTPDLFASLRPLLDAFVDESGDDPKREFRLPDAVHRLILAGTAEVEVIPAGAEWFGMTYQADHDHARRRIEALVDAGVYPARLADG